MSRYFIPLFFSLLISLSLSLPALAVPPPDFLVTAGGSIAQIFSLIVLFLSAIFGGLYQFIKIRFLKTWWGTALLIIAILLLAGGGAYFYQQQNQKSAIKEWLVEVEERDQKPLQPKIATVTTNQQFQALLEQKADILILDARENIEYINGYLEGSTHIRFADLKAGAYKQFSTNQPIVVICWSGIRGQEVAEFLASKGLKASYLETGADGWVAADGQWTGNIKLTQAFPEERYSIVYGTAEMQKFIADNVFLIDTREPEKFAADHIAGSVNIPLIQTPTDALESAFGQIPANSRVITICDAYVNCFDAKLTGIEAEQRGHTFLGRFNRPWDL